jgi:hypothetical protein
LNWHVGAKRLTLEVSDELVKMYYNTVLQKLTGIAVDKTSLDDLLRSLPPTRGKMDPVRLSRGVEYDEGVSLAANVQPS